MDYKCYCGNTINVESGSGVSGKLQTSGCTVLCAASPSEYCGGSARLSMYALNGTKTSSSSTSSSARSTKAFSATGATGSVSSTTSTISTTSSTAATPTVSISCPDDNGTVYTALNGAMFMLECYLDRQGGDLAMGYVSSYADACEQCSTTADCKALSWLPGIGNPNYMKDAINAGITSSGVWGARLLSSAATSTSASEQVLSSTSSSSAGSITSSSRNSTSELGRPVISITDTSLAATTSSALSTLASSITGRPVISNGSPSGSAANLPSASSSSTGSSVFNLSSTVPGSDTTATSAFHFTSQDSLSTSLTFPLSVTSSEHSLGSSTLASSTDHASTSSLVSSVTSSVESPSGSGSAISLILSTTTSSFSSSTSASATSTFSASSTALLAPAGWSYVGCIVDNDSVGNAALQGISLINDGMTITMCTNYCASQKYPLAGV